MDARPLDVAAGLCDAPPMRPLVRVLTSAIAGLCVGAGLGVLLAGRAPEPAAQPASGEGSPQELAALRRDLARARDERDALAARLELLEHAQEQPDATAAPEGMADAEAGGEAVDEEPGKVFDEDWLLARGFPETEIERLRARWDQASLDRLYLTDTAKREGWQGTARYRERSREIEDSLRESLCDEGYDALLYASGRGNRVVVADVLADSPAARVGIERGDALRSYGGERLFNIPELLAATAAGEPGRTTELRIERGGQELRVFAPRGPLGIRVRRERRPPEDLRWPLACRGLG